MRATYQWGDDNAHMTPEDFQFPRCCTKHMWELWHKGTNSIQPFKFLVKYRADLSKTDNSYLTRTVRVMNELLKLARSGHTPILQGKQEIDDGNSTAVFNYAYDALLDELYSSKGNEAAHPGDVNISTIYAKLPPICNKPKRNTSTADRV